MNYNDLYLNFVDNPISPLENNLLGLVPIASGHRTLDAPIMTPVNVGENSKHDSSQPTE
jgi:hypothetical protein